MAPTSSTTLSGCHSRLALNLFSKPSKIHTRETLLSEKRSILASELHRHRTVLDQHQNNGLVNGGLVPSGDASHMISKKDLESLLLKDAEADARVVRLKQYYGDYGGRPGVEADWELRDIPVPVEDLDQHTTHIHDWAKALGLTCKAAENCTQ